MLYPKNGLNTHTVEDKMDGGSSLLPPLMTMQTDFIDTMQVTLFILGALPTAKVRMRHILL